MPIGTRLYFVFQQFSNPVWLQSWVFVSWDLSTMTQFSDDPESDAILQKVRAVFDAVLPLVSLFTRSAVVKLCSTACCMCYICFPQLVDSYTWNMSR